MDTGKQAHLDSIRRIKTEFISILKGMDYCLDWKQDESEWSVREIVYHILETPPGGAPNLVNKIISGDVREYEIWSDLTNLTSERAAHDIDQVNSDIEAFFGNLSDSILNLPDRDLVDKKAVMHQKTRDIVETRTLDAILEATLNRHISEHLIQLRSIRDALAI